jgi:hypothetical protein
VEIKKSRSNFILIAAAIAIFALLVLLFILAR